ncbi:MAG: hypothetical protein WBA10_13105 [Elainellaceae cyanobacterium]
MSLSIRHLTSIDIPLMDALLTTFGEAFDDEDYTVNQPSEGYLRRLLSNDNFSIDNLTTYR